MDNTHLSIISTPPFTATVGQLYGYDVVATDPEGDPLVFSLNTAPVGMSIDPSLDTIRWLPAADQVGSNTVVIEVMDGQGGEGFQSFAVTVRGVNGPPAITSTPPT